MKNLLSIISENLYHQQVDEKLIITKDTKEKKSNKHVYWAALFNVFCLLDMNNTYMQKFRDSTNDKGDVYYCGLILDHDQLTSDKNRTFFKNNYARANQISHEGLISNQEIKKSISKHINEDVKNLWMFEIINFSKELIYTIQIETNKHYILYIISNNENDIEKINEIFTITDNWEKYNVNILDII